jgi:outer membrane murein-binding lipoprotein Lpp
MKNLLLILIATCALVLVSGCSSSAKVGTKHHHVSVGGSVG